MPGDCILCKNLQQIIQTDSRLFVCLNSDCENKYFYATPIELTRYYIKFLHLTIENKKMRKILSQKFKRGKNQTIEYIMAWKKFCSNIIQSKTILEISILGIYYGKGIGVKKSFDVSNALFNLTQTSLVLEDPQNPCPVCLVNEDDTGSFIMCSVCGNMVCGFCFPKLRNQLCPTCRSPLGGPERITNLRKLIREKSGRVANYARMFLATFYKTSDPTLSYRLVSTAVENGCIKGIVYLAKMYMDGIGVVRSYKTALSILNVGFKKGDASCMVELGYMYSNGYGVSRNRKKGKKYYCKAIEHGEKVYV